MKILTFTIQIPSRGNSDIIDITNDVRKYLKDSLLREGNVLVFVNGSTAAVTTIEYEPGLLKDYPRFFEKLIPSSANYEHNNTWHDGNGHSHVRAALQGPSITIPFADYELLLGTWQQVVLIDFDNRSRQRSVVLQFTGTVE